MIAHICAINMKQSGEWTERGMHAPQSEQSVNEEEASEAPAREWEIVFDQLSSQQLSSFSYKNKYDKLFQGVIL